jgi:biopolymer transport protein ExbD
VKQNRVGILIAIGENNEIYINRRQIDLAAVRANVERLHAENPQGGAVIQADEKAATGVLVEIMDQVRLAGVGAISIAAEEK